MKPIEIPWQSEMYDQEIALRSEVLRAPLGMIYTPEHLAAEQTELRFGIVDDQQLVACVLVLPLSSTLAKLRQMAVIPDRQGQGIGAQLVRFVEQSLAERGFDTVKLHAREVAMGFYQKLGYQQVGDSFIEVSVPHFKMTKQIRP